MSALDSGAQSRRRARVLQMRAFGMLGRHGPRLGVPPSLAAATYFGRFLLRWLF